MELLLPYVQQSDDAASRKTAVVVRFSNPRQRLLLSRYDDVPVITFAQVFLYCREKQIMMLFRPVLLLFVVVHVSSRVLSVVRSDIL